METIKRLKDVAEECLKDLKNIDSKASIAEGNLAFLESKKTKLGAEIADMEAKKNAVMESVGTFEKDARAQIEAKFNEIKAKETQLLNDRADLKTKIFQAEAATGEAQDAKEKYSALYSEYLTKAEELDAKKNAVMNALK